MTKEVTEIKDLLNLLPEERLAEIESSTNPAALVQAMPEEEVWLTIKEVGASDCLTIIKHTSPDQVQFILDIETWKRDKWQPKETVEWLRLLAACGRTKIVEWAQKTDIETVVLTFKEFIFIAKKQNSDDDPVQYDWPDEGSPSTLDGIFYYMCPDKNLDDLIRPVFETIGKTDYEYFTKLCEAIMAELKSGLEETAFSWRTKRLAEKGFSSLEESLEVYKYFNSSQISSLPKRNSDVPKARDVIIRYPLMVSGESYPILMLAIAELKEESLVDEISFELANVANKVLIADGRSINLDTIKDSLRKVMGYVNIGLEHLSGADVNRAAKVLSEKWILHLFQAGYSQIARLKQRARKIINTGWPSKVGGDFSLLDQPLEVQLAAILRKRPLYYAPEQEGDQYRDFKSVDDVRVAERMVELASYTGRMMSDVFGISPAEIKSAAGDRENVTWSTVLVTIWAKSILTSQYQFAPLAEGELSELLSKTFDDVGLDATTNFLKPASLAGFVEWLTERQPNLSPNEEEYFRWFIDYSFARFMDEFSEIPLDKPVDSRFVQSIWVIPSSE